MNDYRAAIDRYDQTITDYMATTGTGRRADLFTESGQQPEAGIFPRSQARGCDAEIAKRQMKVIQDDMQRARST